MEIKILSYIFLCNFICSLICFSYFIAKKEKSKAFLLFFFMMLCPVLGLCFILLSWLLKTFFFKKDIDIGDLSFHTEKLEMIIVPDFAKEINVVSVEEALLVSDNDDKRRVILDLLKEDYNNSLTVITNALESDDSETSHYVASVITDVKSNFKVTVQKMQENLADYPDNVEISCLLMDYIQNFLDKEVLSEIEKLTYIDLYVHLMGKLYHYQKEAITGKMYKKMIYNLLEIRKNNEAIIWGERAISECPNELDSFKGVLKLYFDTGEKSKFFEVLSKMKNSNIEFDNESLELVRFFQV